MSNESPRPLHRITGALLALFFFLLPLQTRWIVRAPIDHGVPYEYGTLSVFLVEILGWAVIVLGLTLSKLSFGWEKLSFTRVRMILIGLVAFGFFSIFWAADKAVAFQAAVRLLEAVLLYFVLSFAPTPPNLPSGPGRGSLRDRGGNDSISPPLGGGVRGGVQWLAWSFLAGATVQALLGIYQFLSQSSFASKWLGMAQHAPQVLGTAVVEFTDERWLRAYGGLPHPNVLGGYLVVALAVALVLLVTQRAEQSSKIIPDRGRFCYVGLKTIIPILLTGIFFSFSRAAWIAAIVLLGYWVIGLCKSPSPPPESSPIKGEEQKRNSPPLVGGVRGGGVGEGVARNRIYALFVVCYMAVLVMVFRPLVTTRLHADSRLEIKSRTERVSGLREAWVLIKKHPVFGVGIGNYTQALKRDIRPGEPLYSYQPVHNVPLLIFAELGFVGLALFVAALYFIVRQSKANAFMFLCLFVLMFVDHYLWALPFGILFFWSVFALSTTYKQGSS